ncbi:alpha/beta hydrolase [Bosea eneae]|uniref:Alpha/beta hydrolase n=1 Tax=Bosea eneae TaxID=151454 RepID=A0ABW0J042_9HYPH
MTQSASAQTPVFVDQVSREAIDPRLNPVAREIAVGAARGPGLPAAFPAKRAAFDQVFRDLAGPPVDVANVQDARVRRPDGGEVPVRIYRPASGTLPVLVWTHGGGFEKGGLDSHDAPLRRLANACGCAVVSVGYRLAPEHRFPAQTDDAYAVLTWAAREAAAQRFDGGRIAVGGDSVGGNLASVSAIRARDEGGPSIALQVLFYPVTDVTLSSDSWRRFANGPWLSRAYEENALQRQYLPAGHDQRDPRVSPLYADPRGLPPAFVADAEFDGYRDEGQAYARRLNEAGASVTARIYPGMIHDFFLMTGRLPAARQLVDDAGYELRRAFGTLPTGER